MFYVKDTGTGIKESYQKEVFERFKQGEMISERLVKGTGLGLTICKGIVELLGGEIWMESTVGKGTDIFFTIPYETGELTAEDADLKTSGKIPDLSGKTYFDC